MSFRPENEVSEGFIGDRTVNTGLAFRDLAGVRNLR